MAEIAIAKPLKLLERLRLVLMEKQLSSSQVRQSVAWVEACIRYHGLRHPRELGAEHVDQFVRESRLILKLDSTVRSLSR